MCLKIKNNFIAYYLLLIKASPRKLQPYYHTYIYTLIRLIARMIIKIKRAPSFKKIETFKKFKKIILGLKKIKNYGLIDYFSLPKFSRKVLFRISTAIIIISVISMQSLAISGFEAHVINVTAKIVNDIPLIQADGEEFCNITGATITITTTYTATSTIIYTTDGSNPDCLGNGNLYIAPFTIYQSATVKARTCHDEKQSAVMSKYFDVAMDHCPPSNCEAETIAYWQNHDGCQNIPASSLWQVQINDLSINHFQGAFAATTAEEICTAFDLTSCPAEGTLTGELCRAKGETLADLSNIVTGKLDLNAVIAGAFDNSANFTNLSLAASSTIEQALNKIESVLVDTSATLENFANAGFVAQRIYTFYNSENPYAPTATCIYYEPSDVVLNEFVPNPSCSAQPVDVVMVMDRSGSMGYDSPTRLSRAKIAANSFIDNLQSNDQSALVSYATTATLNKNLSNIHAATKTAISSLAATGATNIGDAINLANNELVSSRANPLASKVEILLTDGLANKPYGPGNGEWPADVAYAKAKADLAAGQGIKIFTIGLGVDVNATMLEYIATTTGAKYYYAPTGAELAAIYNQISEELCGQGDNDQNLIGLAGEWVELYNKGIAQKDLADWIIGNAATTTVVKINSGNTYGNLTTINGVGSGLEWLVVLFNQARLNNLNDTIFFYDNIHHLLDFYSYASSTDSDPDNDPANTPGEANVLDGNLAGQEGKSFARIPDGTGDWVDPIPTPGGPNLLEDNLILTDELINEIATSSAETASDQNVIATSSPEIMNDENDNNLATEQKNNINTNNSSELISDNPGSNITDNTAEAEDQEELTNPDGNLNNNNDDENADLPAPDSSPDPDSTPDPLATGENSEPGDQIEENSGEPVISPDQGIIESVDEIAGTANGNNNASSMPEEAKTESASEPTPSEDKPAVIDTPQEQATEPTAATPAEATPNGETTTL